MLESDPTTRYMPILRVGLSLQLTIESAQGTVQSSATLLGWKDGSWLICEWPFQFGQAIACEPGTRCLVRYIMAGKLIGYKSEVRFTQTSPIPILYLAFPQAVEEVHLRKHVRVPGNEQLLVMQVDQVGSLDSKGDSAMVGLLQDLSVAGCRGEFLQPCPRVPQGSTVHLEFELVGIGYVSHLTGVIKTVAEQETVEAVGIEFRFDGKESIEYRGWGGSVQKAIQQAVLQKQHVVGGSSASVPKRS